MAPGLGSFWCMHNLQVMQLAITFRRFVILRVAHQLFPGITLHIADPWTRFWTVSNIVSGLRPIEAKLPNCGSIAFRHNGPHMALHH